jgi:hypothetical protein
MSIRRHMLLAAGYLLVVLMATCMRLRLRMGDWRGSMRLAARLHHRRELRMAEYISGRLTVVFIALMLATVG